MYIIRVVGSSFYSVRAFRGIVMNDRKYIIAYDIGSTSNKTCLYEIRRGVEQGIKLISEASEKYPLYMVENGGVEQSPDDWWISMRVTTPKVIAGAGINRDQVEAISFCSQMQGLVLVDKQGETLRPAMSYMDKRATKEFEEWCAGSVKIAGINARKLLISLNETGVVAGSAKDPVFRYKWVRDNEPEIFEKIYKWLDVKDYLVLRATGVACGSRDSAFATLLYNEKEGHFGSKVCGLHEVDKDHLPDIVECTDMVGRLTKKASEELGLDEDCKVFSGGGDSALIGVGAGCAEVGDTHIYIGTSGWVSTVVDKAMVDTKAMIASAVGIQPGKYNYFAEMETSGKCIEWARDNIVKDSINAYGDVSFDDAEVLDVMTASAARSPAGSGGVIFLPWLLGNRCPFEDADCRGGFFNISLTTKEEDLIRAVLEGILFHKKWMLESQDNKIQTSRVIRAVGGGARSDLICQIFADITGRKVERCLDPQGAGAFGAAILMAYGLKCIESLDEAKNLVKVEKEFIPDPADRASYDKAYKVFKLLYKQNKENFNLMNREV